MANYCIFNFQIDLIATIILFLIIRYIFKVNYLTVFYFLMIINYFVEYSKFHEKLFKYFKRHPTFTIIRTIMVFPFAVIGFTFGAFNIINKIKNFRFQAFIIKYDNLDFFVIFSPINDII